MSNGIPQRILDAFKTNSTGIPAYVTPAYLAQTEDPTTAGGIVFLIIATLIVSIFRGYSRVSIIKNIGIDDWLALFSLVLFIVFSALCIGIIDTGASRHNEYVQYIMTDAELNLAQVLDFYAHIIYVSALFACRLSGLAFYYRLCDRNQRMILIVRLGVLFLILGYIPQIFLMIFHCLPVTSLWPNYWQSNFKDFTCMPWLTIYSTNSTISIASDLVLFCIPIAIIYKLKAGMKTKVMLSMVMLPGLLVIVLSSVRLWIVLNSNNFPDGSWIYGPQLVVECAEVGCTIIALSIPGLKPLVQVWLGFFNVHLKTFAGSRSSRSRTTHPALSHAEPYTRATSQSSIVERPYPRVDSDDNLLVGGERKGGMGIEVTTEIMQMRDLAKSRRE